LVAVAWVLIAVLFDYIFIVMMLSAQDYYKADVFLYYTATFLIPLAMGLKYRRTGK
jgi:hypothetical protein